MRKRAQFRSKPVTYEPKHISEFKSKTFDKKSNAVRKNWWVAIALISIFFLVLFFNTYFNLTSEIAINHEGEGYSKYLLSGPDPYYNLRLVEETSKTGTYPYYSELDPLLNYPVRTFGGRAPLLNMMALGFSNFLTPFMDEVDAIGYSMQFIPALFGALIIFPIYYIGKILFNKKAGLAAAFFIAIIPIHIGSGHGSAYSLFDHDSINLFLYFLTFLFMLLSIKEKDNIKSIFYAIIAGVFLAGLSMVWTEARFLYVVIAIYAVVQMLVDIFSSKIEINVFRATAVTMLSGYLISLPVVISRANVSGFSFDVTFFMVFFVVGFGFLYYVFGVKKIPWTVSLPLVFIAGGLGLAVIYFARVLSESFRFLSGLASLSNVVFGTGIYGNKVSMTIAEAGTFQMSQTVMSFGPALYWVAFAGFIFGLWYCYKDKLRRDYLFFIVLFAIFFWLTSVAGRFLNEFVPFIAIFAGVIVWYAVDKINYKQMIKNIRSAGGGIHGIRRGVKIIHIFGIVLLAFVVILPNIFITIDAAIPNKAYLSDEKSWSSWKQDYFADENYSAAFGLSLYKEAYWADAFDWLAHQDLYDSDGNLLDPIDKPAFISWWDYGFYGVALSRHPVVADNFQSGIPPAGNFHTATSEKDAVAVLIIRVLEGNKKDGNGKLSEGVKEILVRYLGNEKTDEFVGWIEDPSSSPSYHKWVNEEFNDYVREEFDKNLLKVGAQWAENAVYHDVIDLFNDETYGLTEEEVTWLYRDIQEETGYSIRYYGVEGYDRHIFNIFGFLSDKSLVMLGAPEDEFVTALYSGYRLRSDGSIDYNSPINNKPFKEYLDMPDSEKRYIYITDTSYSFKDAYFNTMFYRTYIGPTSVDSLGQKSMYNWQVPCLDMKHFYAEYISNISNPFFLYQGTNKAAVVISKYYEGTLISGSVYFQGKPISTNVSVVVRKNLSYIPDNPSFDTPVDYDRYELGPSDITGNFSLIAGAGAYISVVRNPEIRYYEAGILPFTLASVMFDDEFDSNYFPITEDDAMRKSGSNFERFINITIHPTNVSGFIYEDIDRDGSYDAKDVDRPLGGVNLYFYEIEKFDETQITRGILAPKIINELPTIVTTDDEGFYNVSGLLPGYYALNVYDGDYIIYQEIIPFKAGDHILNISRPVNSSLSGTVYYNKDTDPKYNPGVDERISGADVELIYYSYLQMKEISVKNTTTDVNGYYSFTDIAPSDNYAVKAVKGSTYEAIEAIQLKENTTQIFNISMDLTPVTVSGYVKGLDNMPIQDVNVLFKEDGSVSENTAVEDDTITDDEGYYSVSLQPGAYNITVWKATTALEYYLEDEKITIVKGQETASKDFTLVKESVTVTGKTLYEDSGVDNVTINFIKDISVINNTAISADVKSGVDGSYNIELTPGTYLVSIDEKEAIDSDKTYIYKASEGLKLTLSESDITTGKIFDVSLSRVPKV